MLIGMTAALAQHWTQRSQVLFYSKIPKAETGLFLAASILLPRYVSCPWPEVIHARNKIP